VHRTIPFTPACQSLAVLWYATAGHHPADVDEHRARAPWYRTKAEPSTADMIAKLRRVLIARNTGHFTPPSRPQQKSTPSGWPGRAQPRNRESRGARPPAKNSGTPQPQPLKSRSRNSKVNCNIRGVSSVVGCLLASSSKMAMIGVAETKSFARLLSVS